MGSVRVYVATTEGAALVQRLAPEEGLADAALSAVCLDGTTTRLPITGAYTYFVRDHVRELSGVDAYRLDLDRRIDGGASWMLSAWIAHFLLTENRLAAQDDAADTAVFATGEVAFAADAERRVEIRPVSHIAEKVERLVERMDEEVAAGRRVLLIIPDSNAEEAEAALGRFSLHDHVTLHAVSDTAEIPALLGSNAAHPARPAEEGGNSPGRRRLRRIAAVAVVCVLAAAAAGYAGWRKAERNWNELLRAGRYLELGRALDGFPLQALAARYRKGLRGRLPGPRTLEIALAARRPADGGSCAGLRFRGGGMKDVPMKAAGGVYRIGALRSLCGFTVSVAGAEDGRAWLVLELLAGEGAPAALKPARRGVSGALAERGLNLFQELPLYLEDSWSWRVRAVWAPVRSADVERLFGNGFTDDAPLSGWKDFGVAVAGARIGLGEPAGGASN